ncbi:uncharacterized protein LOC124262388 [Haliotis rubra]|uniref:uncharacterized protein LOC124262388 n=1 Tax=Haliotis rubra TaxID=36100 RepID=UPI001EE4EC67|nr:uncharacterized protein LOC124262388 [Haliotis rubra]
MSTFLYMAVVICVSTCAQGFQTSGRIDTEKHTFVMQSPYYGLYGTITFTYEISFPEMYGGIDLLAFPRKEMDMAKNSNTSCSDAKFHWHRTLHSFEPSCRYNGEDIYGRMLKCNGRFDLTDNSGQEFYFAIRNCNGMGIRGTHYNLMEGMEVVATASASVSVPSTSCILAFFAAMATVLRI